MDQNAVDNKMDCISSWMHRHKNGIILTGLGFLAIAVGGYYVLKNTDIALGNIRRVSISPNSGLAKQAAVLRDSAHIINDGEAFAVCSHIRKLPLGQQASPEKIAEARLFGIILEAGQTFVDGYVKNATV